MFFEFYLKHLSPGNIFTILNVSSYISKESSLTYDTRSFPRLRIYAQCVQLYKMYIYKNITEMK